MPRILPLLLLLAFSPAFADWSHYGGDAGGTRFVPARQIDAGNVSRLAVAWTYRTGDLGEGYRDSQNLAFEATPILVDGVLYLSTPTGQVHAIDARSGERKWMFDGALPRDRNYSEHTSRGVSFWRGDTPGEPCNSRVFFGTRDARLLALDAYSGEPCAGFGERGVVDLNAGSRPKWPGNYLITSPPAIYRDLVISGSAVGDNGAVDLEYGIVRAFNAITGELAWRFDPLPRSVADAGHDAWRRQQLAKTGAANAWAALSVDEAAGLVYVPTGSASPDYYGGERLGSNPHANSVIALDAATGELRWARQLVHHDLWDYDVPAQPTLAQVVHGGVRRAALIQLAKTGMLYVFDRLTGEDIFPVEERPVPASDVPGESSWPTQPFSTLPPLVEQRPLTPDDAFGLTPVDRWLCRREIQRYRSRGIFTPPSLEGSIVWPSYIGGGNWGGVAIDQDRGIVVTNVSHIPSVVQLLPREEYLAALEDPPFPDSQYTAQSGTPYGMRRQMLVSPLGVPCSRPPWGTLVAVNLNSGRIQWQVPLGTSEDIAPWPFGDIAGTPAIGGPLVTASGLVFIGAALDDYLRAFDLDTGRELWKGRLPAGGQATPMSYQLDGRQYVVIAAGGHGGAGTTAGDYVVAYALPDSG